MAKANETSMGDGIPVHELDDDECPKFRVRQKACDSVALAPVLSGTMNSSTRKRLSMTSPGADSCRSRFTLVFAVCHAKEQLGQGLLDQLLEFLVLAALASCPWLRRIEHVGTQCLQL